MAKIEPCALSPSKAQHGACRRARPRGFDQLSPQHQRQWTVLRTEGAGAAEIRPACEAEAAAGCGDRRGQSRNR